MAGGAALLGPACSIVVKRDLSSVPPGQVGFDDLCGLQDYFDTLELKKAAPPALVSSVDLEKPREKGGGVMHGGRATWQFDTDYQLQTLRRVLEHNYRRLPEELQRARRVQLEVHWSEKAGISRVVTDEEAELAIDGRKWDLPYHVCLSELLYGEPLYRQRRSMWGLPLPGAAAGQPSEAASGSTSPDAGTPAAPEARPSATDAGSSDR